MLNLSDILHNYTVSDERLGISESVAISLENR